MAAGHRRRGLKLTVALAAFLVLGVPARAAAQYKVLYTLPYPDLGVIGSVTVDAEGNVYGATGNGGGGTGCQDQYGCGLIFELTPHSGGKWSFATVHDFTGGSDGAFPNGNLVVDASGNLWGACDGGGAQKVGTVFELTPGAGGWSETVLYNFCNRQGCPSGPQSGVTRDQSGNLYGTADEVAFELSPTSGHWKETALHKFCAKGPPCNDGTDPYAGLILDAAGNLYGTTGYGGTGCGGDGCGTVYELSPEAGGKWKETILHRFDDSNQGAYDPGAGALFMDSSGSLFGTTELGGKAGWGTVFRLTQSGDGPWKEAILYSFGNGPGGGFPDAGVIMDKAGNLYGTTDEGGGPNGCGVMYKLSPAAKGKWKYSVLHTFGRVGDGCLPSGNLAIDSNGNLYGGTIFGGTSGNGVVFELTP